MSNIFLKNELTSFFDTVTESNLPFPKVIKVINRANKEDNETSSTFVQQGGSFSATSTNSSTAQNINKLISMLTSESTSTNAETSTQQLEEQLRSMLNQDGGAKTNKSIKQKGGNEDNLNVNDIKKFFVNLKSQGVKVDVKLNNKTMSEFFNLAENTTTEVPKELEPGAENSETSSININDILGTEKQSGGAKKKKSNKIMDGGVNAGFQAFLNLKKYIADKLGISNGPDAAKVAGAVQKDMKEKHPGMDAVNIAKEGMKHFDANMEHYKRILPNKNK